MFLFVGVFKIQKNGFFSNFIFFVYLSMFRYALIIGFLIIFNGCRELTAFLQHSDPGRNGKLATFATFPIRETQDWVISDVVIISDINDTIHGRVRRPRSGGSKYPIAFLVVGIETGREVVGMIHGFDSVIVFSIDYPYNDEMDFSGWKGLTTLLALRHVGYRSVEQIGVSLDWLSSLPEADTNNISVIAVSFGVFAGVPAAASDQRVDRLVVIQAGGDLETILGANAGRLQVSVAPWIAGLVGKSILVPFEPNDYIGCLSPRPVLLVSGEADKLFPEASIQSLFDHAREPKEWIRHKSGHVDPSMENLIGELALIVGNKLYRN
jgi:hypothetical protein